jgi:dihydropyrimidinase/allantoinase
MTGMTRQPSSPSEADLLIVGGTIVADGVVELATVAIRDGRIVALLDPAARPAASEVVDARGLHVLPGLIDTHVHTRHPGVAAREDFESGTAAAAAGGITTIFEMPIAKVPTDSAVAVAERVAAMTPQAHVDFLLYGGAGHENVDQIHGQAAAGVVAFKTFLQPPPPTRLDEFRGLWCTDYTELRRVMQAVADTGLRHCFHCEYAPMFQALEASLAASGRRTGRAHAEGRPAIVEELSVAMVLALAEDLGASVGVVHASSARSARLVADAKARGVDATIETCPPYLFFTEDELDRLGPLAKCNPPLRSAPEVAALWDAVTNDLIGYIGTDHSPFTAEEKAAGADDIFRALPGLCGLEVMAPLLLTAVNDGRLSLTRMVALSSTNAARIFGLPGKGRVAVGCDADFALVDLEQRWRYDCGRALTRSRANMAIYHGMPLHGRVVHTLVRGVRVFADGALLHRPGHGRFVTPARDCAVARLSGGTV